MRVIFSEDHKLRNARSELYGGELVPPFEAPFRAEWILAAVKDAGFTDVAAPERHGLETALKVHDAGFLAFLETAWDQWKAAGYNGEAIATSFPVRRTSPRVPTQIDGLLGYYGIPKPAGRHRAMPDVEVTTQVLVRLLDDGCADGRWSTLLELDTVAGLQPNRRPHAAPEAEQRALF